MAEPGAVNAPVASLRSARYPSESLARDFRRGAVRSWPFVGFGLIAVFADPPSGVTAILVSLLWLPLTLLEGSVGRGPDSSNQIIRTVLLVWLIVFCWVGGCAVQHGYVVGLWQGLAPGAALAQIDLTSTDQLSLAFAATLLAFPTAPVIAARACLEKPVGPDTVRLGVAQSMVLMALFAAIWASKTSTTPAEFGMFCLMGAVWAVSAGSLSVAVVWTLTSGLDHAEVSVWPHKALAQELPCDAQ